MNIRLRAQGEVETRLCRTKRPWLVLVGLFVSALVHAADAVEADRQSLVLVVGAEGTAEYGADFRNWADRWVEAAGKADAAVVQIGREPGEQEDKDLLRDALAAERTGSSETLWLVLIGHGTFDGRAAKFNLRGTDVSAGELAEWLQPHTRPLVIINCASSSGPFLNALSGRNRVVVTATKSGQEQNFARFGDYLSSAVGSLAADLDKDGQTSILEAYLSASRQVAEFYESNGRLATEHALLDDTGDKLGTPADWFQGLRAVKRAQNAAEVDGRRARQLTLLRSEAERELTAPLRAQRDALELEIERLRDRKAELGEDEYYAQLEAILLHVGKSLRDLHQTPQSRSD